MTIEKVNIEALVSRTVTNAIGLGEAHGTDPQSVALYRDRLVKSECDLLAELRVLRADNEGLREDLIDILTDYISQECTTSEKGVYDSCAISSRADAMWRLYELGRFEIIEEHGRRVIGRFRSNAMTEDGKEAE